MPRPSGTGRSTTRAAIGQTVIELSIPIGETDDAGECYICANDFCDADRCCRLLTHLECCTQAICSGCLIKLAKPCGCREDCREIIAFCPFCRDISPVSVRDVFFGYKNPCSTCVVPVSSSSPQSPPTASLTVVAEPAEESPD